MNAGARPISTVIPAHDEERVIGRLLRGLAQGRQPGDEVIVVCNGCRDRTAAVARSYPGVQVVDLAAAGKPGALNAGDAAATAFPRFFVDADIDVTSESLHAVADALGGDVLAGAPAIRFDVSRSSAGVRAYYRFWSQVPYFRRGLLGTGVYGMTEEGRRRFAEFPSIIADDEFVRRQFLNRERLTGPPGTFVAVAPRDLASLVRVQTRSRLGSLQLDRLLGPTEAGGTGGLRNALPLLRSPALWVPFLVYGSVRLAVEVRARARHRRRDYGGWATDHSSRG
ncbi:MAG TPA: glycosyltransferase family 2 protein [Acidimicrobiales bacterium]|nr:glycosyltransferase family 2 protein [Acidimicrobiales bacterium]